jgi:hypothetical protein
MGEFSGELVGAALLVILCAGGGLVEGWRSGRGSRVSFFALSS